MKFLPFFLVLLNTCGLGNTETERQEVIDRLRALGVSPNPTVSQIPAATDAPSFVTLTLIAALPGDAPVAVEPWINPNRVGADVALTTAEMTLDPTTELKVGPLRILTIKAKAVVPNEKRWKSDNPGGTVQYGFKMVSGDRAEYVTGEFLAYKKGRDELKLQPPVVTLADPVNGSVLEKDKQNVVYMTYTKPYDELMLPAWFVSGGVINSRRSDTTTWKVTDSGEYTIIAGIRGRETLGFSYQAIKVTVP